MDEKIGIAVIEDHPVMRSSLEAYFKGTGRWNVTGTASTLSEAKILLAAVPADVVILDLQLEDGWGLDIIPWLVAQGSNRPVTAVYSNYDDYAHVSAALGMGVQAYVCKRRDEKELEKALFTALGGGIYVDNTAQVRLQTVQDLFSLLTKRETEILCLVKSGLSNKQIAAHLNISARTVENILSCVYDKTGIKSRLELQKI